MLIEIIGAVASIWTLLQPIFIILGTLGKAVKWLAGSAMKNRPPYVLVRADRLTELENIEAALQLLVEQLDGSRAALGQYTAERKAQ